MMKFISCYDEIRSDQSSLFLIPRVELTRLTCSVTLLKHHHPFLSTELSLWEYLTIFLSQQHLRNEDEQL
jgi:hypothetical protein